MPEVLQDVLARPDFNYIAVLTVLGLLLIYLIPMNYILGKRVEKEEDAKEDAIDLTKSARADLDKVLHESIDSEIRFNKQLEEEIGVRERVLSAVDELEEALMLFRVYCQVDGGNKDSSLEPTFVDDVKEMDEITVGSRGEVSTGKTMDEVAYTEGEVEMKSK